jgi:hypothetical protein
VQLEIRGGDWKSARTRGKRSPSRYKLEEYGTDDLLPGVVQVIGHTPPEKLARGHDVTESVELAPREVGGAALASASLYLVDPSVQWALPEPAGSHAVRCDGAPSLGCYRYAAVSRGRITVHKSGRVRGGHTSRGDRAR